MQKQRAINKTVSAVLPVLPVAGGPGGMVGAGNTARRQAAKRPMLHIIT